ncbi:flagellar basal body rod protein FlgG [Nitrospira sp. KM1]|uniref:flagellar basal body rod protein FlgC n=1 Tax=Nitrospira sp. KM1 TaxID=1936990 RepID=UPI0013A72D5B|nr:flagellar basal body rod C-terminal domain-containing protein [Nitrospira sp. KM1]BCA53381.1 flagellar basal body rod protein FlgG [Nitrospira sp. KM1]
MLPAIHTALSGLSAFSKSVEVTAHNLANVNTDGFKKSKTEFVEIETGGVLPVVEKDNVEGPAVLKNSDHGPVPVTLSNVDVGEESVNLIMAQRAFEANLQTLRTAGQMLGSVLDIQK